MKSEVAVRRVPLDNDICVRKERKPKRGILRYDLRMRDYFGVMHCFLHTIIAARMYSTAEKACLVKYLFRKAPQT